jgi:hypothetical protein
LHKNAEDGERGRVEEEKGGGRLEHQTIVT